MKINNLSFGRHAIAALLESSSATIKLLHVLKTQDAKLQQLIAKAEKMGVQIKWCSRKRLDQLSNSANHQGLVAELMATTVGGEFDFNEQLENSDLILVLDGVQDPHNLGACLRSADAFGAGMVVVPKDNAVGLTPVVRKVACGAAETVPLQQVTNLARSLKQLQDAGFWLVGLAGETDINLSSLDLSGKVAIVMGAEGKGLRKLTREICDFLVKIPMQGSVESLNVSVATGISLYEVRRAQGA